MELQSRVEELQAQGIGLATISYDSREVLAAFAKQPSIAYPMLSDQGSATIKRYGILNTVVAEASGPNNDDLARQGGRAEVHLDREPDTEHEWDCLPWYAASTVAGVIAGLVFGVLMQMMTAPTPGGRQVPVIAMIGQIITGSPDVMMGWVYHLFNSAIIGAIFGWFLGTRVHGHGSGLGWGAAYGFGWWILGGLILMPVLLGMPAFAPLMMPEMQMVAMGSLVGHLIYGLILGGQYVTLFRGARVLA